MTDFKRETDDTGSIALVGDTTEWDFVDDIDKIVTDTDPESINKNDVVDEDEDGNKDDIQKEGNVTNANKYDINNLYYDNVTPPTAAVRDVNYYVIARAIATLVLMYYCCSFLGEYVYTRRITGMIGTVDYFPENSKYIQMHKDKCSEVYEYNQNLLDTCIEANRDSKGCLNEYLLLIDKHKEFCDWDKPTIESQQKAHIRYIKLLGGLNKLTKASKDYVEKIPDVLLISSEQSWRLGGNMFSFTKKQLENFTKFFKNKIEFQRIFGTSKKLHKNLEKTLGNNAGALVSASKNLSEKIYKGSSELLSNGGVVSCSFSSKLGNSFSQSFNYIANRFNAGNIAINESVHKVYAALGGLF